MQSPNWWKHRESKLKRSSKNSEKNHECTSRSTPSTYKFPRSNSSYTCSYKKDKFGLHLNVNDWQLGQEMEEKARQVRRGAPMAEVAPEVPWRGRSPASLAIASAPFRLPSKQRKWRQVSDFPSKIKMGRLKHPCSALRFSIRTIRMVSSVIWYEKNNNSLLKKLALSVWKS